MADQICCLDMGVWITQMSVGIPKVFELLGLISARSHNIKMSAGLLFIFRETCHHNCREKEHSGQARSYSPEPVLLEHLLKGPEQGVKAPEGLTSLPTAQQSKQLHPWCWAWLREARS